MRKYDTYKDSGIEWIGEIPEHWEVKRFKYSLGLVNERIEEEATQIGLENIESWTGKYLKTGSEFEGDGIYFLPKDILFGKLRPYLAKVLLAEFKGKAVGDFFVFRAKQNMNSNFVSKFIRSKNFIDIVNSSTFGSKMPRASWDFISDLKISIPTPEGLHILKSKHTKACKLNVCGLFVFYSILIHSIIRIKTVSNSVSQSLTYRYSLKAC